MIEKPQLEDKNFRDPRTLVLQMHLAVHPGGEKTNGDI
jgi:hypothetical protein